MVYYSILKYVILNYIYITYCVVYDLILYNIRSAFFHGDKIIRKYMTISPTTNRVLNRPTSKEYSFDQHRWARHKWKQDTSIWRGCKSPPECRGSTARAAAKMPPSSRWSMSPRAETVQSARVWGGSTGLDCWLLPFKNFWLGRTSNTNPSNYEKPNVSWILVMIRKIIITIIITIMTTF